MPVASQQGSTAGPDEFRVTGERSGDGPRPGGRYRYMLALVDQGETPMTIDQLVDPMVEWEHETGGGESKTWSEVHRELYLVDLPVLDQSGMLSFDVTRGIVDANTGE